MNPGRGIALKIISTFVFTLMLVCVKAVAGRIPPGEIVFARSFFALIPVLGMLIWQGQFIESVRTKRPLLHVSRGALGIGSMALGFLALGFLPLPESMMIGYAAPLMVVALSAIVLRETVRVYRWSATAVGFVGILVILWPRLTLLEAGLDDIALVGASLALAGAFVSAIASITVRTMTKTESTSAIVLYLALIGSSMSLLSLPFGWVMPGLWDAGLLAAIGLLGGIGQIMMTTAYRHADAATIASFEYVSMIWGLTFGYLFFSDVPTPSIIAGGLIVVAAGIFIIFRERQLGIERKRERSSTPATPR